MNRPRFCLAKSGSHSLLALLLLVCPVSGAAAAQLVLTTSLRVGETFSNNVEFSAKENRQSGYATEIEPRIGFAVLGSRAGLEISTRLFHTRLHEPVQRAQTTSITEGEARASIIPHKLYLKSNFNYGDRSFRPLRLSRPPNEGIADVDQGKFGTGSISPTWYELLGDKYAQIINYNYSSSFGDSRFSQRNDRHRLTWYLSNAPVDSRLQWRLRARHAYDGDTGDLERRQLVAGAGWYVSENFTWLARVGSETIDDREVTNAEDGSFWSAGFSWLAQPGIEIGLLVGESDRQLQFSFNATPRTSLVLGVLDRDSGFDTDSRRYFGGFHHQGRFSSLRSIYTESYLDGSAVSLSLINAGQLLNSGGLGDVIAVDFGNGQNGFAQLDVITGQVIQRTWGNQFSYQRARNSLSVDYQEDRIVPLAGQAARRSQIFSVNVGRSHGHRWQSQAFGQWSLSSADGFPSSELTFFGYSLNRSLTSRWQFGVQVDRRDLHRRRDGDISETRLTGFLRYRYKGAVRSQIGEKSGASVVGNPRYTPNRDGLSSSSRANSVDTLLDDFSDFSQLQAERVREGRGGSENSLFDTGERFENDFDLRTF